MEFGLNEGRTTVNGPLKLAGTMFPDTKDVEKRLNILFKDKLIWAAASLHESEENEILEAYKIAKQRIPNLVLIIIPRAIELSENTVKKALRYSKSVLKRSDYCDLPKKETEILVVNRIGELGLWYKLAFISFIGNSLNFKDIKTGKNPFEALQANSIVIHGPKMSEPGYEKPALLGISEVVENRNDISSAVVEYSVANRRKEKIKRGQDLIQGNKAITQKLIAYISEIYKTRDQVVSYKN
jgi:3-deoxy-D-manno-octulosonic-acid transferase